jgi:hypothetical protein
MCLPEKSEVVAYGKCVSPQVTPRVRTHRIQTRPPGKVLHIFTGKRCDISPVHAFSLADSTLILY